MFQYVRQAGTRWLGIAYILQRADGSQVYAMDISGLTPEQTSDLEERYYQQITLHHESLVKSDGILELDMAAGFVTGSQFPKERALFSLMKLMPQQCTKYRYNRLKIL